MVRHVITSLGYQVNPREFELILTQTKPVARSLKTPQKTIESIAETTVKQQGRRIASVLTSRRLLQKAISQVLKVKDLTGITALWTPAVQEFLANGCDLAELSQHPVTRVAQIAQVALIYQQELRKRNCLDRSELFWLAAQHVKQIKQKKQCLIYGYFLPDLSMATFINALAKDHSCWVLPIENSAIFSSNQTISQWLEQHNWHISDRKNKTNSPNSEPSQRPIYQSFPNLEAEVRGALAQVKALLQQGAKANQIVLVTQDEPLYGSTLLDVAWEYDVPIRAFYDVPLVETRFGAWLELLLGILEEYNSSRQLDFDSVTKLLAHPLVKKLNAANWPEIRTQYPQNIQQWRELGIDLNQLKLPSQAQSDRWLEIIQQILNQFEVSTRVKPWAKEIVAYYKFQDALQELCLANSRNYTNLEIIPEISELVASLHVPIQPGRGGVELHAPAALFGSQYQYVFVLGMAENIFPQAISEDLVLNYSDRKQLAQSGIDCQTILNLSQRAELSFYFLQSIATQKLTFSYPELIGQKPTFPSPYLQDLEAVPFTKDYLASPEELNQAYLEQPEPIIKLLQPDLATQKHLLALQTKLQVEQNRIAQIPDEYNGAVGIALDSDRFTFSASQLTQIGQCPFKWFSARLLKLKEQAETKLVLENNIRGSLYHKCLELCLEQIKTPQDLANFDRQQLLQALATAEQELAVENVLAWEQQKQELLYLLNFNLNANEFLPADCEVIEREIRFDTQWHGLQVTGTIDRIDRTSDGIKVIDYKTSKNPPLGIKDESGKAAIDLQIPLYTDATRQEYPEEPVSAIYYSLSSAKPIPKKKNHKSDPETLAKFAQQVKQHLSEGSYPIEPDVQCKACEYCQFDLVCRVKRSR